jgi:hypothetical protein
MSDSFLLLVFVYVGVVFDPKISSQVLQHNHELQVTYVQGKI